MKTRKKVTRARRPARGTAVGMSAIAGLKEAIAHAKGKAVPGLVVHKPVDVKAIRQRTGLRKPASRPSSASPLRP